MSRGEFSGGSPPSNEEAIWQMNMRSSETIEIGAYPERPEEEDCSYYIKTGLCRFGETCRYNHPRNRNMVTDNSWMNGEFPERIGEPECQYYLKTGTCKFGVTCKFHHPRDKAGIEGRVAFNILGYPLRPNEAECPYYIRTGQCKFVSTCKFHHPQPSNMTVSLHGSPAYPAANLQTIPGLQSYPGRITNLSLSRASFIPSPRWQGPPSYAPLIMPQGVVSIRGLNTYSGQLGSVSSPDSHQQTGGNSQVYATSYQTEPETVGPQGTFSQYRFRSVPVGIYGLQRDNVFPERPGQSECQFYMKTGDCKFGAVCKFHHPRERMMPAPDCMLSPMGLPSRPGEPVCIFYSRYGICKFGPSCKFDHPTGIFTYNLPGYSSSGVAALSLSETRQMPSGDDDIDPEA